MKKENLKSHKNSFNLLNIIILEFFDLLVKRFVKPQKFNAPKEIGSYKLKFKFKKQWKSDTGKLGIYESIDGKKAFGKTVNYKYKNASYIKLKNEIEIYKLIDKVISNLTKKNKSKFNSFRIPKFIHSSESKNSLSLLVEYVEGIRADNLSSDDKFNLYIKNIDFLDNLGSSMSNSQKNTFYKRTSINYVLLYPLLLIFALIRNFESRKELLRGAFIFIKNFNLLFLQNKLVLTHRDLHFKNIIVNEKENILIDFESAVFTVPYYDVVTTLRYEWNDLEFTKLLISTIEKENILNNKFENYFKLLMIISSTHGLTANNFSKKEINQINKFLSFGLAYKFNKTNIQGAFS